LAGFTLEGLQMVRLSTPGVDPLLAHTAPSNPCAAAVVVALSRANGVKKLVALTGGLEDGRRAGSGMGHSLRGHFDRRETHTNIGCAQTEAEAAQAWAHFFPGEEGRAAGEEGVDMEGSRQMVKRSASLVETICIVLLPRLVQDGEVDHALDRILRDGYKLVQCRTCALSPPQAARYVALSGAPASTVGEWALGQGIVLCVEKINAVTQFRMLLAGKGRPESASLGRLASGNDPVWQLRNAPLQAQHGDLILSSTTLERARREAAFFFGELLLGEDQIEPTPGAPTGKPPQAKKGAGKKKVVIEETDSRLPAASDMNELE
jgi:nucleoside diphosphate kinase